VVGRGRRLQSKAAAAVVRLLEGLGDIGDALEPLGEGGALPGGEGAADRAEAVDGAVVVERGGAARESGAEQLTLVISATLLVASFAGVQLASMTREPSSQIFKCPPLLA
jgi:hypothetical protein